MFSHNQFRSDSVGNARVYTDFWFQHNQGSPLTILVRINNSCFFGDFDKFPWLRSCLCYKTSVHIASDNFVTLVTLVSNTCITRSWWSNMLNSNACVVRGVTLTMELDTGALITANGVCLHLLVPSVHSTQWCFLHNQVCRYVANFHFESKGQSTLLMTFHPNFNTWP